MILHSCLAALGFIISTISTVAGAESTGNSLPDDTLQRYLAQSRFCITGHFISVKATCPLSGASLAISAMFKSWKQLKAI